MEKKTVRELDAEKCYEDSFKDRLIKNVEGEILNNEVQKIKECDEKIKNATKEQDALLQYSSSSTDKETGYCLQNA